MPTDTEEQSLTLVTTADMGDYVRLVTDIATTPVSSVMTLTNLQTLVGGAGGADLAAIWALNA